MKDNTLSLPLVSEPAPPANWHGFTAVAAPGSPAAETPEPDAPQGEYAGEDVPLSVPVPFPVSR